MRSVEGVPEKVAGVIAIGLLVSPAVLTGCGVPEQKQVPTFRAPEERLADNLSQIVNLSQIWEFLFNPRTP